MNKINRINLWLLLFYSTVITSTVSCKKLVETPPPSNFVTEANAYSIDATAIAVLNGIYISLNRNGIDNPVQGNNSIALFAGLSADEFDLNRGVTNIACLEYYQNSLIQTLGNPSSSGAEHWGPLYNYIFKCNAAIEGLNASNSLTPSIKQQLLGEARFLRGFLYFYLVNLFGDVPLVLGTDPQVNTLLARSSKGDVYEQIIADLTEAESLLSDVFLDGTLLNETEERVRPTKWAAIAMLARVYLYNENYQQSEVKATAVITNSDLFSQLPALNDAFLRNSDEAIWQIQPTDQNFNTTEARTFIIPPTGPHTISTPVKLSNSLLNSFEVGDQRAAYGNWVDTTIYQVDEVTTDTVFYPFKYKINSSPEATDASSLTEYFMVLRLGEQYLIRAEAKAQQGNIDGAQSDLNAIRNRAGLVNTTAADQPSLLAAILNERRHELFSEWGHRWLDLKRTEKIDEVMTTLTPIKSNGTTQWQSYQQWYPLPLTELQQAPNLVQNTGY